MNRHDLLIISHQCFNCTLAETYLQFDEITMKFQVIFIALVVFVMEIHGYGNQRESNQLFPH